MKRIVTLLLLLSQGLVFSQNGQAYLIFDKNGKKTSFDQLLKSTEKAEVIYFGELHDDPIAHFLQNEIAHYLKKKSAFAIGAEMFELHQQAGLDSLVASKDFKTFEKNHKLWSNYQTDYKPLLEWAIQNNINYFASNVTRKYASQVFKLGIASLDTLSESQKKFMCPLPFPVDTSLSQYQELIKMGMEMHQSGLQFAQAQAIKDATMGYRIVEQLKNAPKILHLNGAFHTDFFQGIYWYVNYYKPGTKQLTISTVQQEDITKLSEEFKGKADFIIVVPNTMTRTM